jgi:hypothetical protein
VSLAASLAVDGRLGRFEVHALDSRVRWGAGVFAANCRANLGLALPSGITLNAILWRERNGGLQFHERLIVTDIGGVLVDPGIDDGDPNETYVLRLLSRQEIPEYLAKFAQATSPYDLVDQQLVTGS